MNVKAQNMNVIGIMPIISFDHLASTISFGLMQPDHKNISYFDVFVFLFLILICILYQYKFMNYKYVDISYIGIFNHLILNYKSTC